MGGAYCCGDNSEYIKIEKSVYFSQTTHTDIRPVSTCQINDIKDISGLYLQLKSNIKSIVKLQALARGIITRRKLAKKLKQETDDDFKLGRLVLLRDNHNIQIVKNISKVLGPFDYDVSRFTKEPYKLNEFTKLALVKRPVVWFEDGIQFEGEWTKGN